MFRDLVPSAELILRQENLNYPMTFCINDTSIGVNEQS